MASLSDLAQGRHPSVTAAARWLTVNPALPADLALVSVLFENLGAQLLQNVKADDPELTRALGLLTQAKDAAVRAAIADRAQALQR